jgi:uncharacterized protein (DUF433 family)
MFSQRFFRHIESTALNTNGSWHQTESFTEDGCSDSLAGMKEVKIVSDPKILMGKPVIAGTRLSVELILEKLAAGETVAQLLLEHPLLTEEGIRAAMKFAAEALKADVLYPVGNVA